MVHLLFDNKNPAYLSPFAAFLKHAVVGVVKLSKSLFLLSVHYALSLPIVKPHQATFYLVSNGFLFQTQATPKLPSQKRHSLYSRRGLRPQSASVMDGISLDDIPDLLPKTNSAGTSLTLDADPSSLNTAASNGDKLKHLVKSRPKRPKTRAPTRAAVVVLPTNLNGNGNSIDEYDDEEDSLNDKLDDGLDSFFKNVLATAKPIPQPRTALTRNLAAHIGDKRFDRPTSKSPADEMSVSMTAGEPSQLSPSVVSSNLLSKVDEVTRSISSPCLKRQQSLPQSTYLASVSPRTCSPGAEEIAAILNRVGSPSVADQQDLLAEMKAKGGKRSLAPTPTFPTTTTEEAQSIMSMGTAAVVALASSAPNSSSLAKNIRMRASAFGDVLKSPSKTSIMSDDSSLQENPPATKASKQIGSKQRPKSVVGMIGAKFQSGAEIPLDGDCSDVSQSDSTPSTKVEEVSKEPKGMVRKTLAVFKSRAGSVDNPSSNSNDSKKMTRSKFYTSSSLSSAAKDSSKK